MLDHTFFAQDAQQLAQALLGKVIYVLHQGNWLAAKIIETEAYYLIDKGSHASLGYTEKRKALFMQPGTIYMYYARGGDSINVSARGEGNAVLIKSAFPYQDNKTAPNMLEIMQALNPNKHHKTLRPMERLCSGQTLLCKSLGLKVPEWNQRQFDKEALYIADVSYKPRCVIQTTRLGISPGRDEDLPYRFVDSAYAACCSKPIKRLAETQQNLIRYTT